jgi:hypothetical protein
LSLAVSSAFLIAFVTFLWYFVLVFSLFFIFNTGSGYQNRRFDQGFTQSSFLTDVIFSNLNVFSQNEIFNNGNRFLRWGFNNELVFTVESGEPHYASKVLLQAKSDNQWDKWSYDENTKQIIGINDFCLGVGGAYELMLKDCSETLVNTIWHFDEMGRLVGVVNVTGIHEAKCAQGEEVGDIHQRRNGAQADGGEAGL